MGSSSIWQNPKSALRHPLPHPLHEYLWFAHFEYHRCTQDLVAGALSAASFWGQSPNSPSLRLAHRVRRKAPQRNWCLTPITRGTAAELSAPAARSIRPAFRTQPEVDCAGRVAPQSPTRQSTMPALDTSVGRQPSNSADISSAIGGITRPVSAARPGPCRLARLK